MTAYSYETFKDSNGYQRVRVTQEDKTVKMRDVNNLLEPIGDWYDVEVITDKDCTHELLEAWNMLPEKEKPEPSGMEAHWKHWNDNRFNQ